MAQTKIVTVEFDNDPKSERGPRSIKADDGTYYKYWPSGRGAVKGRDLIKKGATLVITFDEQENGQYTDRVISSVSPASSGTASATSTASPATDRDVLIVNQCSIKAAAELGGSVEEVIDNAQEFTDWVFAYKPKSLREKASDAFDPFEGE